jgi:antitoxin PrlF
MVCAKVIRMATSTVTDKGQTTVPMEIREALGVKPRQQLHWTLQNDGSAVVRRHGRAAELFASLRPTRSFSGRAAEREGTLRALGERAAKKGR